jgi:hypothetical protein
MTITEALWVYFSRLWWVPLLFLGIKFAAKVAVAYGKFRNMR